MDDVKICSKCQTFYSKSNFLKTLLKKMVIDIIVKFALKSIIIIIRIQY